ncbi:hypothetical protein J7J47_02775 [Halomonas sp. ISL-60]|nr:hypothetical protein [Halomonas sp. ISL-60]
MIKKAVLLLSTAPFLMVFSINAFSWTMMSTPKSMGKAQQIISDHSKSPGFVYRINPYKVNWGTQSYMIYEILRMRTDNFNPSDLEKYTIYNHRYTDEQCASSFSGSSVPISPSSANYLNNGGSISAGGGSCSVTGGGGVTACTSVDGETKCTITLEASSSGEKSSAENNDIDLTDTPEGDGTFSVIDLNTPEYLEPLPGGCSDPSSCVTIGDTSYLVDWDSTPDYFSYVDSNGTTHSNSSSGGGSGGDTGGGDNGGGNPTDPTDPGGDNGGGDSGGDTGGGDDSGNDDSEDNNGGGGSGGGSTVPDFEFDESGIIEAIGSAGRSNRNAISALSNDVTGAISDQTNDINNETSAQTDALNRTLSNQTDSLKSSLDDQTNDLSGVIDDQTGTLTGSLDALGTSIVDAINGLGSDEDDSDGGGEGEDEGDGLLGDISDLLNGMVDNLASRFTEDLGDGDDLFDSSGMDDTLDGVAVQEEQHSDEINTLMDEIGEGATSGIAEQITSRLPSLPSGGCVPLQFGPMEISCQAFNTIKLWLTWIIYFWTVVSIVDTFFRSEQRTA